MWPKEDSSELLVFGIIPDGRRKSLSQRTSPREEKEGDKGETLSETPYLRAGRWR